MRIFVGHTQALTLTAVAVVAVTMVTSHSAVASRQQPTIVALDMIPSDDSGASIASVQSCISVKGGDVFDVDFLISAAPEISGFQLRLGFDPQILKIRSGNAGLLLGEGGLEIGDTSFPITSGSWLYGYTNSPSRPGSGVLLRASLEALSSGSSKLRLPVGPLDTTLIDSSLTPIPIEGVIEGTVKVGSECTADETSPKVLKPVPGLHPPGPDSAPAVATASAASTATAVAQLEETPGPSSPDPAETTAVQPTQPDTPQTSSKRDGDTTTAAIAGGAAGLVAVLSVLTLAYLKRHRRRPPD